MPQSAERIHSRRQGPDEVPADRGERSALATAKDGGLVFAIAAMLWLLGFVTGLTPWLGMRDYEFLYRPGAPDSSSDLEIGTRVMLLLRGQTAYVDYKVEGNRGGEIYVDVAPWPGLRLSDRTRIVAAGEAGRAEFPIAETGVYHFKVTPTPSSYRDTLRFQANWGAK